MEPASTVWRSDATCAESFFPKVYKRLKMVSERRGNQVYFHTGLPAEPEQKKQKPAVEVVDYSDPLAIRNLLDDLDSDKYGSVTKDIESLCAQNMQMLGVYHAAYPTLFNRHLNMEKCRYQETLRLANENVIDSDGTHDPNSTSSKSKHIVVLDSDDEDSGCQRLPLAYQEVVLNKPGSEFPANDTVLMDGERSKPKIKNENISSEVIERDHNKGVYVGVEDDIEMGERSPGADAEDDGLADIWKEMSFALECSKDTVADASFDGSTKESKGDCDHSFVLKDDIGYVCRICGVIDRGIDTIIEYVKSSRPRAYRSEHRSDRNGQSTQPLTGGLNLNGHDGTFTDICAHPRHMKQMKPHQVEGFNFLLSNLVCDNPGGCILAHAPGSGKTFMIISFMQSFLAKYPFAKPLVVLPKGILSTWKKEFQRWQIEDMPLLDFYSVKADGRSQQLEVLHKWVEQKSILFLGYKQFSTIVCSNETSKAAASCEEILLKAPSILILDEGHTPRNENTDVLQSLAKVQTPRKVVLSGTLYQNHVKEVFNILNLVRPRFLKTESSRAVVKRILSRVQITGIRKQVKSGVDAAFYDVVEHTLQKEEDFKRKVTVIQDLREMTRGVLHYYKGDFLDELPGLVDFTVLLNLSARQRSEVGKLKKFDRKFKVSSVGSALYLHPQLICFSDNSATDATMDEMLGKVDTRDGVKAKFYLNLLGLCASAGEKLLVFSQYLLPLKFLERLTVKTRGWSLGREIFVISGESSSDDREWSMDRFNNSPDARVFFGSIKACGEGISLVGASRILILDVHLNPSVTRQAIGRAFRPGQENKVYVYRLIAADSLEQDDHVTCFKKELISRMWFEWNEYCGYQHFQMETIGTDDSGDPFLESPFLREDVRLLYRR